MRFKFTALYIALIVAVNYAFTVVPLVKLPDGTMWPPVALLVGFVFVARDFAQREAGHKVMADPFVATASAAAFLVSELIDWAVYSFTGKTLSQRILYSSLLGAPVDSAIFLGLLGLLSPVGALAMTASKLLGAVIVWWMIRKREENDAINA